MGKTAKRRKELKRKREEEEIKLSIKDGVTEEDLAVTARTLTYLATLDYETLHCKAYKEIRRSVFAFASAAGEDFGEGKSHKPQWIAKISDALHEGKWDHALNLMKAARVGIVPKLGTLQRWVRDADLAGESDPNIKNHHRGINWVVLDAILRTSQQATFRSGSDMPHTTYSDGKLRIFPSWDPLEPENRKISPEYSLDAPEDLEISLVTTEKRWKGVRDLSIYTTETQVISETPPQEFTPKKHLLPFVDGGFVCSDIFSREECNRFIGIAEKMDFVPDAEYSMNPENSESPGRAAAGVVWLASDQLIASIYQRVERFLPAVLGGGAVAGLNKRLRVYRYNSGGVYRPHVDGAWPGSGIVDGEYVFDAYGDRWSRLTFLIYLNEGFEGGSTTFYGPSETEGVLDGRGVVPRAGSVLVFPHGDTAGALVHEGSELIAGTKYVIRSDVLYIGKQETSMGAPTNPPSPPNGQASKRLSEPSADSPPRKLARLGK